MTSTTEKAKTGPEATGGLVWRKKGWGGRVRVLVDGEYVRKVIDLGTKDKAVARRKLAKLVESAGEPEKHVPKVLLSDFFDVCAEELSIGDQANIRLHIVDAIGDVPLSEIKFSHIRAVRDKVSKSMSHGSAIKILGGLRRLLDLAREAEHIDANPALGVRIRRPRGEARPIEKQRAILMDEELDTLLHCEAVDLELRMLSVCARIVGGMRTSEVIRWDWSMIDRVHFAACFVLRSKTAEAQALDVPEVLRPWLRFWWERAGCPDSGPVFPVRHGKTAGGFKAKRGTSFAKRLRKGLLKAGIDRHELHHETATTLPADFHSFRRLFCTVLASSGVNEQTARRLANHKDAKTHQRYIGAIPEARRIPEAAVPKLGTLTGQAPKTAAKSEASPKRPLRRKSSLLRRFRAKKAVSEGEGRTFESCVARQESLDSKRFLTAALQGSKHNRARSLPSSAEGLPVDDFAACEAWSALGAEVFDEVGAGGR